ncbi:MAG: type VI secretion system baseplate subunit TssF, partial [Holosporales bacterium]|nr:type VI secretion system baseplate subunit TssF [Holosporales bacterium]
SIIDNGQTLWNLISQLSATHISMANSNNLLDGITKLVEIFSYGMKLKQSEVLDGITNLTINKIVRRIGSDAWRGFVNGLEVKVYMKEDSDSFYKFLFCSVLNQYLSASISINSFIELSLISDNSKKTIAKWNPTSGRQDLL